MKKRLKSFAGLFLLILLSSCATDQLEINETSTANNEKVWEYNGDNSTLLKVIAELKNSENRKPLERRLSKNEVLWKEAKFLLIDDKKRIMVPFLSTDKENVIGVLALVKDAQGKTTFDMAVRSRLSTKDNKLPFWNPDIWMGYFMASDKDILGIKNGNPGFKQTIANNQKTKSNARTVCDLYETVTSHCSYAYLYNSATGEKYNYVDRGCTDTYSYNWQCYWVPDPITEPTTNPGGDGSGGDGGGSGGGGGGITSPCQSATTNTSLSQNNTYISAKTNIITASTDGKEHGISLGRDSNGNTIQGTMKNGGTNNVEVDKTVLGVFADIHNHPNNKPLSAGDIYALVKLNNEINTFTTKFILTDGDVYSIVINDLTAANIFVKDNPAYINLPYPPDFPQAIFDEIEDLKPYMGYGIEDRTKAMAYVLDKYQSGITLLKQDSNGNFVPLKIQETSPNIYSIINCD